MSLPIDRTNLTAAQTNQVPNIILRSALNIAAILTPYDTIDELYNYTKGRLDTTILSITNVDAGLFTDSYTTGVDFSIDGGSFV